MGATLGFWVASVRKGMLQRTMVKEKMMIADGGGKSVLEKMVVEKMMIADGGGKVSIRGAI